MSDLINKVIELLRNDEKFIKANLLEIQKSFKGQIDVRLCVELSDSMLSVDTWAMYSGDPSYDQRHYPICAATVIDTRSAKIDDVFEDLLNQCLDHAAEIQG